MTSTPNPAPLQTIRNEPSFVFGTSSTRVAVTRLGGMMAPVTFFADSSAPIEPYYVAPWADAGAPPDTIPLLAALRGDFFSAPFGDNTAPHEGVQHPPHGEICAADWSFDSVNESSSCAALRMHFDFKGIPGRLVKELAVREGESVVYSRHTFEGVGTSMPMGHHATLYVPDAGGQGYLSFSPFNAAWTYLEPVETPVTGGQSCLRPAARVDDLRACPLAAGGTTDLTRYPARRGFEDIVLLHSREDLPFAWSALSVPQLGYVWFALKDPRVLVSTMVWMSNGGRTRSPWSGRNFNTLGIEDITGHFHQGIVPSLQKNFLNEQGVRTIVELDASKPLRIRYIQGVVRVQPDFKGVFAIEALGDDRIRISDDAGHSVETNVALSFLQSGTLQDCIV